MKLKDVYYCIIGCDGFFDPTNKDEVNDNIAQFVFDGLNQGKKGSVILGEYIDNLVPEDINNNNALGTDNCSAILVKIFHKDEVNEEDIGNNNDNINNVGNEINHKNEINHNSE